MPKNKNVVVSFKPFSAKQFKAFAKTAGIKTVSDDQKKVVNEMGEAGKTVDDIVKFLTPKAVVEKKLVVRDVGGNRLSTRAHAINSVLIAADKPMSAADIETAVHTSDLGKAYAKANGKQVGAIRNHLQALLVGTLVKNEAGKWSWVVNADEELLTKVEVQKARAEAIAAEAKK